MKHYCNNHVTVVALEVSPLVSSPAVYRWRRMRRISLVFHVSNEDRSVISVRNALPTFNRDSPNPNQIQSNRSTSPLRSQLSLLSRNSTTSSRRLAFYEPLLRSNSFPSLHFASPPCSPITNRLPTKLGTSLPGISFSIWNFARHPVQ